MIKSDGMGLNVYFTYRSLFDLKICVFCLRFIDDDDNCRGKKQLILRLSLFIPQSGASSFYFLSSSCCPKTMNNNTKTNNCISVSKACALLYMNDIVRENIIFA